VPWVVANYDTDIMRAVFGMYEEFGVEYRLMPGTGAGGLGPYWPAYLFNRDPLQLPLALGALGHGGRAHSYDEYYVIEGNDRACPEPGRRIYGLAGAEKGYVATIYNYVGNNQD